MKIYSVLKLLIFSLILLSCSKYLDIKNNNKQAVPRTLPDLQALLDAQTYMNDLRTSSFAQAASDDYFLLDSRLNSLSQESRSLYVWERFDYYYRNDWSEAYFPIYQANYCLDIIAGIGKEVENKALWDNVYGSAHFFRAYYQLNLLWTYAKTYDERERETESGIVIRKSSDFNVPSSIASMGASYDQVISDAEVALEHLPDFPKVRTRPSKMSAHGLLARAYLSMREYEKALSHASRSLELYSALIDFNNPEDGIKIDDNVPFTRETKETLFYSESAQGNGIHSPSSSLVDTVLYQLFEDGDLRKRAYFMPNGNYMRFKGTHSHSINWLFTGLTTAEMYLISAECKARDSDIQGCMADLNHLLKHRYANTSPYQPRNAFTSTEALQMVLGERRKELMFRGIRWSDIKRLNKEGFNIRPTRMMNGERVSIEPNTEQYKFALPKDLENYF